MSTRDIIDTTVHNLRWSRGLDVCEMAWLRMAISLIIEDMRRERLI